MKTIRLRSPHDFAEWRAAARALLLAGVPPGEVAWEQASGLDLFDIAEAGPAPVTGRAVGVVPKRFLALARIAIRHPDPGRFDLLYRLLWRLQKDKELLSEMSDVDVGKLNRRVAAVRKLAKAGNLEPAQSISPASERNREEREMARTEPAGTMARRVRRDQVPDEAEAAEIVSLADARAAVQGCRRCPLYQHATQAVFGEGPARARIMFVGEQPGDQEDLQGKPFVGPAGKVFDAALEKAGIPRRAVYVTNAVKHFKFEPRGKRRIHQRPDRGEIVACRFWLDLEREFVKPQVVVALGATAAQSLFGKAVTITASRGRAMALEDGSALFVTIHPSLLLRMRPGGDVAAETARFEADLRRVAAYAESLAPKAGAG